MHFGGWVCWNELLLSLLYKPYHDRLGGGKWGQFVQKRGQGKKAKRKGVISPGVWEWDV